MDIVGFSGEKEVGKDTAAEALIAVYGFKRKAFADPLKEMCAVAFPDHIKLEELHDQTKKEKKFKKALVVGPNSILALIKESRLRGVELTTEQGYNLQKSLLAQQFENPRQLLQFVGTEGFRQNVSDDYWLKLFKNSIEGENKIVVTDARFPNERAFVRSIGGNTVRVKRPGKGSSGHVSESSLGDDSEYDLVLMNDGSIKELQDKVIDWYGSSRD
jgi:hypothetical protein